MNFKEGQYKQVLGYFRQPLSPRNTQGLSASGEIDDELWIILEYYSEVEEVGLKFLKGKRLINSIQRKNVFRYFQAYVRQAKNYYYSAKSLSPKSSGLIYYYCFLNLIKAALIIENPSIVGKRINHGLTYDVNKNATFDKETVVVKKNGVFPMFYSWYFNRVIKPQSLNLSVLLSYCTDISYQCQLASVYEPKIHQAYYAMCTNQKEKTGWALVGVSGAKELLRYRKSFSMFFSSFEKVELPKPACREIFNIDAYSQSYFTFFQSVDIKPWLSDNIPPSLELRYEILKAFENAFQANYFGENPDFMISLPYRQKNQIRADETIAIYLIMYYLSNLVRYKPEFLEGLLSRKESWLIDSFVRSCPTTFLRSMISRITGTDYIIEKR